MASRPVSKVIFGGSGINNPSPYDWSDYSYYPDYNPEQSYVRMNVITKDDDEMIDVEVTGLLVFSEGQVQMAPTDRVYLPCPPFCKR